MFYDHYCRLCKEHGKSATGAALEMGISKSAVSTWKNLGRTPKIDQLQKIASYFDVSVDSLVYDWDNDPDGRLASVAGPRWDALLEQHGGDVSAAWTAMQAVEKDQAAEAAKLRVAEPRTTVLPEGATRFDAQQVAPLLGTVRAGMPMYAEENIEGYIPIRQADGARYFWLNIRGDSMTAAGMNEGDQILVREQPEVENGELAVVLVNSDEATVKQFRQEGDLIILTPKSLNPVHQPQVYDLKKTPVRVLGRVVECRKVY